MDTEILPIVQQAKSDALKSCPQCTSVNVNPNVWPKKAKMTVCIIAKIDIDKTGNKAKTKEGNGDRTNAANKPVFLSCMRAIAENETRNTIERDKLLIKKN